MATPLLDRNVKAGGFVSPPYNNYFEVDGRLEQTGIVGGFQSAVLHSMNVSYDIVLGDEHGTRYPNGTYRGIFGMVQRGEVDMTFFTYPVNEFLVKDFHSVPVFRFDPVSIVSGMKRLYVEDDFAISTTFEPNVWLSILISWIGVTLVTWLLSMYQSGAQQQRARLSLTGQFLSYFEVLLMNATSMPLDSDPVRLVFLAWSLGCLFLGTLLSGAIRGSLVVQVPAPRINSVRDVVQRELEDPPMTPYTLKMGFIESGIGESTVEEYQIMHSLMLRRGGYITSYWDLFSPRVIDAIMEGRAVQLSNEMAFSDRHEVACSKPGRHFHVGSEPVMNMWLAWYSNKDTLPSRFLVAMTKRTQWLIESGVQFYREEQLVSRLRSCIIDTSSSRRLAQEAQQLSPRDIRTAFYFFMVFNGVALLVFAAEWFAGRAKDRSGLRIMRTRISMLPLNK
uniref:Putative glutamate receptor u1-like protein n=1 Tax=Ixodes ricinus TaxID=34613 RepID=A0A147BPA9_IXORI